MTQEEKRKKNRERAAVYRLKKGTKSRPPAITPEEKKRRHREAEKRRRRELGVQPRVILLTPEKRHEARIQRQSRYRLKKRMRLTEQTSREIE